MKHHLRKLSWAIIFTTLTAVVILGMASLLVRPGRHLISTYLPKQPAAVAVQGLVYKDLIASQAAAAENKHYGAYVLNVDKQYIAYFARMFSNNIPRVDFGTNIFAFPDNFIIDKITEKPCKLFWANVQAISNNTAEVEAGWYAGPMASEVILYRLVFNGTNWVIVVRSVRGVS